MSATPMDAFRKIMDDIWANSPDAEPYRWPAGDGERPLTGWACDADEYATGRVRIREHVLVDRGGRLRLATTLLRQPTRER